MKKLFLGSILLMALTAGHTQTSAAPKPAQATAASKAKILFTALDYNFGNIPAGTPVSHVFTFKNTGTEPLVLTNVQPACGCTTPEWPREAIKPGATASIKATFNAQGSGEFNKTITVTSNGTPASVTLSFKGVLKAAVTQAVPVQNAVPKKN
ncbi:MAG: DUF1573 domain-containing protein [Bacteroidota bacterium]